MLRSIKTRSSDICKDYIEGKCHKGIKCPLMHKKILIGMPIIQNAKNESIRRRLRNQRRQTKRLVTIKKPLTNSKMTKAEHDRLLRKIRKIDEILRREVFTNSETLTYKIEVN
jgi:hypothetical protein